MALMSPTGAMVSLQAMPAKIVHTGLAAKMAWML
jgi:hypothetical protein